MKIFFIIIYFSISINAFAEMKALMSQGHGDVMSAEYSVLNTGARILRIREKLGMDNNKNPILKERQIIDLKMKEGEVLSGANGFRCHNSNDKYVYGIISKAEAKEKSKFHPSRGWVVNESEFKLEPISDVKTVSCEWHRQGDEPFPFK